MRVRKLESDNCVDDRPIQWLKGDEISRNNSKQTKMNFKTKCISAHFKIHGKGITEKVKQKSIRNL